MDRMTSLCDTHTGTLFPVASCHKLHVDVGCADWPAAPSSLLQLSAHGHTPGTMCFFSLLGELALFYSQKCGQWSWQHLDACPGEFSVDVFGLDAVLQSGPFLDWT